MFANFLFQNAVYRILLWFLLSVIFFKNYVGLDPNVEQTDGKLKIIKKEKEEILMSTKGNNLIIFFC